MRPPVSLMAVTVSGSLLGAGLALAGLGARLFPSIASPFGPSGLWTGRGEVWGIGIRAWAWPMIALGCAWLAVVLGQWMRLAWTRRVGFILAAATAPFLGIAVILGAAAVAGLLSPSLSRWLLTGDDAVVS